MHKHKIVPALAAFGVAISIAAALPGPKSLERHIVFSGVSASELAHDGRRTALTVKQYCDVELNACHWSASDGSRVGTCTCSTGNEVYIAWAFRAVFVGRQRADRSSAGSNMVGAITTTGP